MKAIHRAKEYQGRRAIRLLHTSDLHLGAHYRSGARTEGDKAEESLRRLIRVAADSGSDLIVIAGDLFDSNRVPDEVGERAAELLGAARVPVLILPGNHDPIVDGSVYERFASQFPNNVRILRSQQDGIVYLNRANVQVWGHAHLSYDDFDPCAEKPTWTADNGSTDWRIAVAHGHFVRNHYDERFSYRIRFEDLGRLEADYVALGHWDTHESVGKGDVVAYYSGSPARIHSLNIVDFVEGTVSVERFLLAPP